MDIYMDNSRKFDGVDYKNTFAQSISTMYELVREVLSAQICNGDHILDIGGGPGMGARIIDEMGIKAIVTNIEPSTTINDVPNLLSVEYIPLHISLKEALDTRMPYTADCILMVSSAHEIALCNNMGSMENKKMFFHDLDSFIRKNLAPGGKVILGFPNYRKDASMAEIEHQRRLTESLLGHSHPPDELFTIEEFSSAFNTLPMVFIQKPMDLTHENPGTTALMANVAVFRLNNI